MQNDNIYPPEPYMLLWATIGITMLFTLVLWYAFIFIYTRKKKEKRIANLQQLQVIKPDLTELKNKYLALVVEVEQKVAATEINDRAAHQQLSLLLRYFAYEASGLKVHIFTLSDLKKSKFTNLAKVIEVYYPPEFSKIEKGDPINSCAIAKELIITWS